MKQIGKIVGIALVVSMCMGMASVFAMDRFYKDLDDGTSDGEKKFDWTNKRLYYPWYPKTPEQCEQLFTDWYVTIETSPACRMLFSTLGKGAVVLVAKFVWSLATAYCAPGDVLTLGEMVVCPAVDGIDWIFSGAQGLIMYLFCNAVGFIEVHQGEIALNPEL